MDGANLVDEGRADFRARQYHAARTVWDLVSGSYGPGGNAKFVQQGDQSYRYVRSGALALRESLQADPDIQPYVDLAGAVVEHAGDQASLAVLLASALVERALDLESRGLPIPASLDGYALAEKQVRSVMAALARPDPSGQCLETVLFDRPTWASVVREGLQAASKTGVLDLDAVDVQVKGTADPVWLPGVVTHPQYTPPRLATGPARVLVLFDDWKPFVYREDLQYTITSKHGLVDFIAHEDGLRQKAVEHVVGLGVTFVACANQVDPYVAEALASRGVVVWNDAPKSALQRLQQATGATRVMRPQHAREGDLGRGVLRVTPKRMTLEGAGASWTLQVPGLVGLAVEAAKDDAEKLIRATGLWLAEPEAVPGGMRWQRAAAASLRRAAPEAPGKSPLAFEAAAHALDRVADTCVRNLGLDPSRVREPDVQVLDGYRGARVAVSGAFELARTLLRLDNRYVKRVSDASYIRGTTGRPTKVEAGDVPPDM